LAKGTAPALRSIVGDLSVDGDMFDALIAAVEIEGEAAKT
jgi:hypothetical protein